MVRFVIRLLSCSLSHCFNYSSVRLRCQTLIYRCLTNVDCKFHHDMISYRFYNNTIFSDITKSDYDSTRLDTGACDQYEMISYAHLMQSTHKKQQKYNLTILLLNS